LDIPICDNEHIGSSNTC